MERCVHCNARHGIFEDWAKCNEKRVFDANLDRWARGMDTEDMEITRRLDRYVRIYRG